MSATKITEPGIYHISEAEYFADPCPEPSLSHSILRMLLQSPRKAWFNHARLNPNYEPREPTAAMEDGSILHALCLGDGPKVVPIDAPDWRTKAAKEQRDAARAAGQLPILAHRMSELTAIADAVRAQLAEHRDAADLLTDGTAETTIVWREGDIWCRALVDWLPNDPRAWVGDLKFTGKSAGPEEWQRTLQKDYATQDAWYLRGLRALGRRHPGMKFAVTETTQPPMLATYACAPSLRAAAEDDIEQGIAIWRQCMSRNEWPGYPPHTMHVDAAAWRMNITEDRRMVAENMLEGARA